MSLDAFRDRFADTFTEEGGAPGDATQFHDAYSDRYGGARPGEGVYHDEFCDSYGECGAQPEPVSKWRLFTRDPQLRHFGQAVRILAFESQLRYCDVHTWSLTLAFDDPLVAELDVEGAGIDLMYGSEVIVGGVCDTQVRTRKKGENTITFSGVSDELVLSDAVAHPAPTEVTDNDQLPADVGSFTTEADVRTGPAESVILAYVDANVGPGALGPRRDPQVSLVGPDEARGAVVTGEARMENLLEFLQPLATAGGVGFRVRRTSEPYGLIVECFEPRDRTREVQFSLDVGSLTSYEWGRTRPGATRAYVGGPGEGVLRRFVEVGAPDGEALWGRIETFVDAGNAQTDLEMELVGLAQLAEDAGTFEVSVGPVAYVHGARFIDDWKLGDVVTVVVDGIVLHEQVREAKLVATPTGMRVTPVISGPENTTLIGAEEFVEQQQRRLAARVAKLESR